MLGVIVIILLVFIGTPLLIGGLIYFIPRMLGYPRLAMGLVVAYIGAIILFGLMILFTDDHFTKKDAQGLLAKIDIQLKDEFQVMENKSEWIGGYYHTFTLGISENDEHNAVQSFRTAAEKAENSLSRTVANYESDTSMRTMLEISNDEGKTIRFQITISKTRNTLKYEEY